MPVATRKRSARKTRSIIDADVQELYEAKLASSGLTLEDAEQLGFEILDGEAVQALNRTWQKAPAFRLPYFDHHGEPYGDVPRAPPFYRLRFLERGYQFADQAGKERRYVQPRESVPCLYLPRLGTDWPSVMANPDVALVITEGELKAACACKAGFPTVGLGGVWNFRAWKQGVDFLPQLAAFNLIHRNVYICFDSDVTTNENVGAALKELSEELVSRGAHVHVVLLPTLDGEAKTGLDDFLVFHGERAAEEFAAVLSDSMPLGLTKALFALNERFLYVADPGLLLDLKTKAKHKPGALKEHLAAPETTALKELNANGEVRFKRTSAGAEWLRWPLRQEVSRITYAPGKPTYIQNGLRLYNTWAGWGTEPKAGSVKPFLALLDHLFTGADRGAKEWFLRWLAYPLQYPGTKLFSSAVIHGRVHGTGKSLVAVTMGRIYGKNYTAIKQKHVNDERYEWAQDRQFVLADDVTGTDRREVADALKTLITQESIRINPKYVPSYEVPDCINYMFTSNQADSFFLEDTDRRFFIHEVTGQPLEEFFYADYMLWLDTTGPAALFDYLLKLDLGDFNPAAPAFETGAKRRMIANVRSDLGAWVRQLLESPDDVLKLGAVPVKRDLFTNKELLLFFDPEHRTNVTAQGLGRELARAGAAQVLEGTPVRTARGQDRYYAIRNGGRWSRAERKEITAHLEAAFAHKATKF